jgi:hypothetical protein
LIIYIEIGSPGNKAHDCDRRLEALSSISLEIWNVVKGSLQIGEGKASKFLEERRRARNAKLNSRITLDCRRINRYQSARPMLLL